MPSECSKVLGDCKGIGGLAWGVELLGVDLGLAKNVWFDRRIISNLGLFENLEQQSSEVVPMRMK